MTIAIRPVSDLRNHYPEIERSIQESGRPVFLTKNGHGSMVLMSLEQYSALTDQVTSALDEADAIAATDPRRLTHEEVFADIRARIRK